MRGEDGVEDKVGRAFGALKKTIMAMNIGSFLGFFVGIGCAGLIEGQDNKSGGPLCGPPGELTDCDNPGPKYKARYWSCKFWEKGKTVTDLMKG